MIARYLTNRTDWISKLSVCFSMSLVVSTYTGPCLRVRRASDNVESDINFVSGVVDVATIITFIGASTGYVTTMYNQIGGSNHLVQTVPAKQPLLVLGELNSLPILRFDGVDDSMSHTFVTTPSSTSAFLVSKKRTTGLSSQIAWQHRDSTQRLVQMGYDDLGANPTQPLICDARGSTSTIKRMSSIAKSHLNWNIFNFLFNKLGIQQFKLDAVTITDTTSFPAADSFASTITLLGATYTGSYAEIDVAALVLAKEGLPSYQSNEIQNILNTAFAVY